MALRMYFHCIMFIDKRYYYIQKGNTFFKEDDIALLYCMYVLQHTEDAECGPEPGQVPGLQDVDEPLHHHVSLTLTVLYPSQGITSHQRFWGEDKEVKKKRKNYRISFKTLEKNTMTTVLGTEKMRKLKNIVRKCKF